MIVASGARYRRLEVDDLDRFEGAGVYYAATDLEARICGGFDVIVVGGGNSAGQAAIYMAEQKCHVSLVVRRDNLAETMSQYLIERIEADDRIEVLHAHRSARAGRRPRTSSHVTLEHTPSGERRTVVRAGLVLLHRRRARDRVARRLRRARPRRIRPHRPLVAGRCRRRQRVHGREPLPFETSLPGVFAVGDVRQGSMKRVAAAVGEGSSAVRSVHEYLATRTS